MRTMVPRPLAAETGKRNVLYSSLGANLPKPRCEYPGRKAYLLAMHYCCTSAARRVEGMPAHRETRGSTATTSLPNLLLY